MKASQNSFVEHNKASLMTLATLKRLKDIAQKLELSSLHTEIEEFLAHVETRTFSIAVVGEFKRGKSTFINALLEKEILPADIVPTSATLNRVTYGLKPSVQIIYRKKGTEPEKVESIAIDELSKYVTKWTDESQALAATIQEAVISYPIPFCKNNVDIIDTPGLNDDPSMDALTLSVLPSVDAAIFVIMPEAPFAGTEGAFLRNLLKHGIERVIFVVTALDRVKTAQNQARLLSTITDRIKSEITLYAETEYGKGTPKCKQYISKLDKPIVFGLSGYLALKSKVTRDPQLLIDSKFPEFGAMLEKFVTEESGKVVLQSQCHRIQIFCDQILKVLQERQQERELFPIQLQIANNEITGWLELLVQMAQLELEKSKLGSKNYLNSIQPYLQRYQQDVIVAMGRAVSAGAITAEELVPSRFDQLRNKLGAKVEDEVCSSAVKFVEMLIEMTKPPLDAEAKRLVPFAITHKRLLTYIGSHLSLIDRFVTNQVTAGLQKQYSAISLVEKFGITPTFSGISEKENPTPFQHAPNAQILAQRFLPQKGWGTQLKISAPTLNSGSGWIKTAADFVSVKMFENEYKQSMSTYIGQLLQYQQLEGEAEAYINKAFEPFNQWLLEITRTCQEMLLDLRGFHERAAVSLDYKLRELAELQVEVEGNRKTALELSGQLAD